MASPAQDSRAVRERHRPRAAAALAVVDQTPQVPARRARLAAAGVGEPHHRSPVPQRFTQRVGSAAQEPVAVSRARPTFQSEVVAEEEPAKVVKALAVPALRARTESLLSAIPSPQSPSPTSTMHPTSVRRPTTERATPLQHLAGLRPSARPFSFMRTAWPPAASVTPTTPPESGSAQPQRSPPASTASLQSPRRPSRPPALRRRRRHFRSRSRQPSRPSRRSRRRTAMARTESAN